MILLTKLTTGTPFSNPHGPKAEVRAKLTSKWISYNCAVRMPGHLRLSFHVSEGGNSTVLTGIPYHFMQEADALLEAHKDEIIEDFILDLAEKETYPPLGEQNVLFPGDIQRYVPAVIMVADRFMLFGTKIEPLRSWRHLIRYLQENPKFGVDVKSGPMFQAPSYGMEHVSRLWTLTMPHQRRFLPGYAESEKSFTPAVRELLNISKIAAIPPSKEEIAELEYFLISGQTAA